MQYLSQIKGACTLASGRAHRNDSAPGRDCYGDGTCGDGAPDFVPPRASRGGRRSGVILPPERESETPEAVLLESVKAAPRRSSIIKVERCCDCTACLQIIVWSCN
uniref:Uncharacterized protein n=1 Tax=Electrophorus electricus TaxID=8005 RepID=A0A4W4GWV1_ELEEL